MAWLAGGRSDGCVARRGRGREPVFADLEEVLNGRGREPVFADLEEVLNGRGLQI
jgi:hypothetical protein